MMDRGVRRSETAATPTVAVVFDSDGEVAAAVADVAALDVSFVPNVNTSGNPLHPVGGNNTSNLPTTLSETIRP